MWGVGVVVGGEEGEEWEERVSGARRKRGERDTDRSL